MDTELTVIPQGNLRIQEAPKEVLREATEAAKALQQVIRGKHKPVIFNGEQYLEFEDWQTCARFYGLAAKAISTNYVEYGDAKGFEAKAEVIRTSDGMVISSAEAVCLNDEKNWASKPLFQLRSMAQTRACAKALRNVLAWVVVLAGYRPTPAEEMSNGETFHSEEPHKPKDVKGDIPDDMTPNYIMTSGKYVGQTLSQILGQETSSGKQVGKEYLMWCVTPDAKVPAKVKDIISRFLTVMEIQ